MAVMLGRDKVVKTQLMLGTVIKQFRTNVINKNHPLQRKPDQWSDEAKSGLAASVIKHEDIDSIKLCEQIYENSFTNWLIDGLQRLTVLEEFKNNVFAMGKSLRMPMIAYQAEDGSGNVVEYDLRGKKYKDLPDELREEFDNFQVDIVKHLDCTNEEIAYHIDRYNKQTSMNTNQKNVLMMYKVVDSLKRVTKNRFFLDCGEYTAPERKKEVLNRVVEESLMLMFHSDSWKKNAAMAKYLNENAAEEEFNILEEELNRLQKVIDQDTNGQLFNSKNSFIWLATFHKFTSYNIEDIKFADFLNEFQGILHSKTFKEYDNESFDTYDSNRSTKDKKVVMAKLDMVTKLMEEYLHINKEETHSEIEEVVENTTENTVQIISETENNTMSSNEDDETDSNISEQNTGSSDVLQFVQNSVAEDIENEDISEYQDFVDVYIDINSSLYKQCEAALMALTAYAYKTDKDEELATWIEQYQKNSIDKTYSSSQEVNYRYMKRDFDNYINFLNNMEKGRTASVN